jgi:YfiH family protein
LSGVILRENIYRAESLDALDWLEHGFGTRVSVAADRQLTTGRQIHSDRVLVAEGEPGIVGEGDALITNRPGVLLAIRTADCVPILIADGRTRAVAAVHAGWRGTVLGIVSKTIQALAERYGSRPEDLVIAIGPGIGECCFQVGPEVATQFRAIFPERNDLGMRADIDLVEANRRQLTVARVLDDRITISGLCTMCLADTFHSYRRDREAAGRMISLIGVKQ